MKKYIFLISALMLVLLTSCNGNHSSDSSAPVTESSLSEESGTVSENEKEWTVTTTEGNVIKVQEFTNYGNDWTMTTETYKGDIVISRVIGVVKNKEIVKIEEYTFDDVGNQIKKDIEEKSETGDGKTEIHEYIEDGIRYSYTTIYDNEDNIIFDKSAFSYVDGDVMIQEQSASTVTYLESECTKEETVYYKDGEKLGTCIEYKDFENSGILLAQTFLDSDGDKMYDEVIYSDESSDSYVYLENIVYLAEEKNKTDYEFYILDESGEKLLVCNATYSVSDNQCTIVELANNFGADEAINVINGFYSATNDILTYFNDCDKAPIA